MQSDPRIWGGYQPYPHQREAFEAALQVFRQGYHGYMLRMMMGTGKSATASAILGHLALCEVVKRCIVICPVAVMEMWRRELKDRSGVDFEAVVLEGTMAQRQKKLQALCSTEGAACQVAIINTESSWRMSEELEAFGAEMIIVDESHKIKSHTSKQSKGITALAKRSRFRLALTGTPMPNGIIDAFAQFRFLDERIYGKNFYAFRSHYCRMGGFQRHQVVGYINVEEFEEIYDRFSFGVGKDAIGLPDFTVTTRYAILTPEERRAYDEMQRDSVVFLSSQEVVAAPIVITRCLRLSEIAGGFIHDEEGRVHQIAATPSKMAVAKEVIDDVVNSAHEKLVIFARFKAEIEGLMKLCEEMKLGAVKYDGSMTQPEKEAAVAAFIEDDDTKVFIGNIAAAGTGLDGLQTVCSNGLLYSQSYSYSDFDQATSRLHRSGVKNCVNFIRIEALNTIDGKVAEAVEKKRNFADSIGSNWKEVFD